MSLEIVLSNPHEEMLAELREAHGGEIDAHLREIIEGEIHKSFQQSREQ
jgi:hypothetical protein